MRNTIWLLLVFLILGGSAYYYVNQKENKSTISVADRQFAVKDPAVIHKIFLADRKGNQTTLVRDGDDWLYDGKHRARRNAMENLLNAIEKVDINYLPAQAAKPTIISDLATNGIKVELYDQKDQLLKSYYVGGMTNDEMGTYMIMEGADEPYIMHIPGWVGGLRARFDLKGDEWRDRSIFRIPQERIQTVELVYPKQRSKSFVINRNNNGYEVKPYFETTEARTEGFSKGSIEAYLYAFESVRAESFVNHLDSRDSIMETIPFASIRVIDNKGDTTAANFHPIVAYLSRGDDKGSTNEGTVVERYHVATNDGDFLVGQDRNFRKLFYSYDNFFE